jgi:hypothetical protein
MRLENFYTTEVAALTLRDALHKHYMLNPQFTPWNDYKSQNAKKLVKAHDISHLIFGCDTSLLGEMRVQLWAKFAVQKFSFKESLAYARDKEAKVLLKNPVGYSAMLWFFLTHFSEVAKVRKQSQQMSENWVYFDEDKFMAMMVGDVRKQFGINVI